MIEKECIKEYIISLHNGYTEQTPTILQMNS